METGLGESISAEDMVVTHKWNYAHMHTGKEKKLTHTSI